MMRGGVDMVVLGGEVVLLVTLPEREKRMDFLPLHS